jgi:hypothetical protein
VIGGAWPPHLSLVREDRLGHLLGEEHDPGTDIGGRVVAQQRAALEVRERGGEERALAGKVAIGRRA